MARSPKNPLTATFASHIYPEIVLVKKVQGTRQLVLISITARAGRFFSVSLDF